ncbi:hypothetical protein OROMI_018972 [Orobanche minor]
MDLICLRVWGTGSRVVLLSATLTLPRWLVEWLLSLRSGGSVLTAPRLLRRLRFNPAPASGDASVPLVSDGFRAPMAWVEFWVTSIHRSPITVCLRSDGFVLTAPRLLRRLRFRHRLQLAAVLRWLWFPIGSVSGVATANTSGITREEYIELAKKSGQFNEKAIEFQHRVLKTSSIGNETYLPRVVFRPGYTRDLTAGREEEEASMFGAVDELIAATGIRPKDLRILIVNCMVLNTTPSLSVMVINRYKLRHNIHSYNLGGMGCAAGITAVDLVDDLLKAYPGSVAEAEKISRGVQTVRKISQRKLYQ